MLDAGGNDRRLSGHKRNCLTLHVRAHQSTVRVVVLKERDHRGRDRDHHLRADVDIVDFLAVDFDRIVAVTAGHAAVEQAAVFVNRLGGLGDDVLVLDVGGHILDLVGDTAGALFDLAVRRDQEAVLVGARIGSKIGDQTDVRAFRRLDRAEAAVMAVVNVTDVKARALSRKAARAESGHTALVRQLCQRVGLVHELAQRARTEELLDRGRHGADVDQALRGDDIEILQRHALADHALHAAKADAELVLQQLAHAADAAVAQVVDVVGVAHAVSQRVEIVHRGEHIVNDDVLGNEDIDVLTDRILESLALELLHQLAQDDAAHLALDADFSRVKVHKALHIDHAV